MHPMASGFTSAVTESSTYLQKAPSCWTCHSCVRACCSSGSQAAVKVMAHMCSDADEVRLRCRLGTRSLGR